MWSYLYHIPHQLRIHHWVKNVLIGVTVFFAKQPEWLLSSACFFVFLSFCLASSIVYLFNDLVDLPADRQHPTKRFRPLASGIYTPSDIVKMLVVLSILLILCLSQLNNSLWIIVAYLILQLAYTFGLKQYPIIDVACIGTGFVLRILAGGWEADIWISTWIISLVFLLTTGLAIAKRRNDTSFLSAQKLKWQTYPKYNQLMLDRLLLFFFGASFIVYTLYCFSPSVQERLGSNDIYLTSIFVFLGMSRYLWVSFTHQEKLNSPISLLWGDRWLLLIIGAWIASFSFLIY